MASAPHVYTKCDVCNESPTRGMFCVPEEWSLTDAKRGQAKHWPAEPGEPCTSSQQASARTAHEASQPEKSLASSLSAVTID